MLKSRRAGLLAAVCSFGLMTGGASSALAENLADAIALAYQTNPTLQGQRASQRALDESVVQARTGFRPSATGSADYSAADGENSGDAGRGSGAGISISQPIFTGGRVSSQISAAEADIMTGREGLRSVEASVIQAVITAYVDVRRDQERLRISQENVAVLQRQLDEARARFEVGEITRTDVAQAEARFAASRASLASAQAQLAISRASYAAVVGQNPGDLEAEPALEAFLPAQVEDAFSSADENNAQIRGAEFAERASASRVAQARSARRPTVTATGSVGWDASTAPSFAPPIAAGGAFDDYQRSVSGRIGVSVPLFTGGLINSQVRAAEERNNADRQAIEETRRSVLRTVSQAWNSLVGARANLNANEEQVRAARIAFEGVRQEAQVGLRTTLDVLNAEQELRNAELSLINARHDEYVAAAILLSAMGKLEARYLTPGVEQYDAAANGKAFSHKLGWVPWEPVIAIVDRIGAPSKPAAPADTSADTPVSTSN
ncbi:MAG: TolC family outer membrane protein [Caulobacter sp.]|nr:TolC family outer membrane protein [Caulobacter sp.]